MSELKSLYPEHEKLTKAADRRHAIDNFLLWLRAETGVVLGRPYGPHPMEQGSSGIHEVTDAEALTFEFLGVNVRELETERRAMVDAYRKNQ